MYQFFFVGSAKKLVCIVQEAVENIYNINKYNNTGEQQMKKVQKTHFFTKMKQT